MMLTNSSIDIIKSLKIRKITVIPLYDRTAGTYIFEDELISEKEQE